jgi:hypothetical protein
MGFESEGNPWEEMTFLRIKKSVGAMVALASVSFLQGGCAQNAFVPVGAMPKDFAQFAGRPGDGWKPVYRLRECVVWKNRFEDVIAVTCDSRLSLMLNPSGSAQIFQGGRIVLMSSAGPRKDVEVIVYGGNDSKALLTVKAKPANRQPRVVFVRK